ncbi:MAG TPA: UDP-N-acetylmuramoyl-tripeptide--D-alanyl-D-alanine ligase [Steroidobacteraceae bacterium]|nr:UDP-N-acetylmuramoyl-tripeptide--D-alanyl-D-alanine ligase [Steroidobacteraceae bacterium]
MKRTLGDFAHACGGRLEGADRSFTGVSTDTRTLGGGELFVALRGPRFNGHEFLGAAQAAGAAGAVVDSAGALVHAPSAAPFALITVADTQAALVRVATAWRSQYTMPLIGVAGSNGKTTVKEMIAAILAQAGGVLATRGNLNNHIGVPLTLLRIEPTHRFAVIEMGANRAGEVAELARIARPSIGLITNAGAEHLEGFGSLEGVARAEGEMVAALAPEGTAIINADDPYAALWRGMTRARVVSFGTEAADFRARELRAEIAGAEFRTCFTLECALGRTAIELRLAGRHNVANALAAAAAAAAAGASLKQIAAGLQTMRAVQGRLQLKRARSGAWLIDDSYNANPSSVRAGIEVLAGLDGRKWLVLGDMAELGDFAQASHAEIGTFAREHGVERLFATGSLAVLAAESFGPGAHWYPDTEALAHALDAAAAPEVRMLIKGSRVNRLERVVAALLPAADAACSGT